MRVKELPTRSAERSTNIRPLEMNSRGREKKEIAMISYNSNRKSFDRTESTFVGPDSKIPEPGSTYFLNSSTRPGQHRRFARTSQTSPMLRNEMTELMADIDGLPVLFRILVKDVSAESQPDFVSKAADLHSLVSNTLRKMVDRMRGSIPRSDAPSKRPLAIVELISSGEPSVELPTQPSETVLRVGPLELDLLDRTARRGERQIDLRPREYQLLKYMMQWSDTLLTREMLFKDVWHYKFVPETNLVDVHMGRLRRKVDGSNETPMIHNVRGAGFILSAAPVCQDLPTRPPERSTSPVAGEKSPPSLERTLQ
jgi:DNA-binding winged helix-turn-helix (wHTH) protein